MDGVNVAGSGSRELVLDVGEHLLELRAAGYLAQTHRVQVEGGMLQILRVKLVAPSAQLADAPAQPDRAPDAPQAVPLRRRWWLWTTIGVVVVGGAVTAALLLRRDSQKDDRALRTENTPPGATLFALERAR